MHLKTIQIRETPWANLKKKDATKVSVMKRMICKDDINMTKCEPTLQAWVVGTGFACGVTDNDYSILLWFWTFQSLLINTWQFRLWCFSLAATINPWPQNSHLNIPLLDDRGETRQRIKLDQYKYITCEVDIEHTPSRGNTNTNTITSPVRSTMNTLLLVEAEQLLRVELLPTAATHVRLWEEIVRVRVQLQVALLVQCIPMSKDLVGEGMSCKTFFVLAILRKENWVL